MQEFVALRANKFGGLSNIWGANLRRLTSHELTESKLEPDIFNPIYDEIHEFIFGETIEPTRKSLPTFSPTCNLAQTLLSAHEKNNEFSGMVVRPATNAVRFKVSEDENIVIIVAIAFLVAIEMQSIQRNTI